MNMNPLLTIVTVSFNAKGIIEKTIFSVISQSYHNIEYIIIDGGSTDGTQIVIEKYLPKISYYVSERDGGIYYGMNKGIDAATGDYVLFLNAGDVFADSSVLDDLASFVNEHPEAEVIYGDSEQIYEYGSFLVHPKQAYLNNKMSISHQATFVKTELLRTHKFDTKYKYAADFEQLSFFYINGYKFSYCNRLVAKVEMDDGATFRHYKDSVNEAFDIIETRGVNVSKERKSLLFRKSIVRTVKRCLPSFVRIPLFRFIARHYKAL